MARFEFIMPDVGEGLVEVEVVSWLVDVGDTVEENDPVAEVETDKAIVTMPAPATGKIIERLAEEGDRVEVGSLFLVMETEDTAAASEAETSAVADPTEAQEQRPAERRPTRSSGPVRASPVARKLARELGVDLADVTGSGPRGRITTDDVQRHADEQKQRAAAPAGEIEAERVPFRGLRRRIAESLSHSAFTIPHVSGFHEFVVDALVAERERLKPEAEAAGVRLTYLALIVKATVEALQEHPYLNSSLDEDEEVILLKKAYNVGIAIATDAGLVVPVIHNADRLDLFEIANEIERLSERAYAQTLTPAEMRNGTFTISNVGPAGGNYGTSIIRHPEAAILGLGKIEDKAVVRDGDIVALPVLPVSLTFDHRIVDGDVGLAFVATLRRYLEDDPGVLAS